ncbi:Riboflavin biosynthesis protein RibD [Pirellulimonas nuda]|uniref:Riboflavin biosynthesis protein RibD n=1 Tax=Pirellulimonas nuda TaxID=2528009 RepID=A0A518DH39_9BACT|nr:bifunctional diaminohydroxyphosphoribosylaminopyrimidine deaminase/5-amino-6-(5-phosphoribosylamino)uracil reductase RibD [Pirellulimonas nuda]QDU90790.1 Riboflavin biosynthesis protein RibD [Pirellulimonas nuda]
MTDASIDPADPSDRDEHWARRAAELALRGEGLVEPNPMVGCVVVREGRLVGEGWHERFGGPHAEVNALNAAGEGARGATLYVSLEPCCHTGKTPPCTDAILAAGVTRVVAAVADPFPQVAGGGIHRLRAAGVVCELGPGAEPARRVLAPYLKRLATGRPWVIAKWAMTLDGKIATASGDSKWISGEASRAIVQRLRGRMDAIVVGRRTAQLDNPLLIARPPGPRVAARVVVGPIAPDCRLMETIADAPVIVVARSAEEEAACAKLGSLGADVVCLDNDDRVPVVTRLVELLGARGMTNVLVEGGGVLLGSMFDARLVDEAHVFVATKLIGGAGAPSPMGGAGQGTIAAGARLVDAVIEQVEGDVYIRGRLGDGEASSAGA